ncbi:MAG: nucleotidyltransferase family protein [Frankiales bacterium]|nr:nucleotidyltransferase family protein [Frankiales bacterium]
MTTPLRPATPLIECSSGQDVAVAGLLLAAGAGRRMGGPKALIEVGGEPLVRRGIRLLRDGGCDPVVVVVGAASEQVRALCDGAQVVHATDWETGMGASLRAGLAALSDTTAGCLVALVDQPQVGAEVVQRLRAAHAGGARAAVATYAGMARNPVLLDRTIWPGVALAAIGDEGARGWLRAHPELVVQVDCTDVGSPDDLDTPDDLHALIEGAR